MAQNRPARSQAAKIKRGRGTRVRRLLSGRELRENRGGAVKLSGKMTREEKVLEIGPLMVRYNHPVCADRSFEVVFHVG